MNIQWLKVGLRNEAGIVKKIVDLNIGEIAKSNESKVNRISSYLKIDFKIFNILKPIIFVGKCWKETVCFNFLKSTLDFIKNFCVTEKQLYIVYRGKQSNSVKFYRPDKDSEIFKNNYFLRDWFTNVIWTVTLFT